MKFLRPARKKPVQPKLHRQRVLFILPGRAGRDRWVRLVISPTRTPLQLFICIISTIRCSRFSSPIAVSSFWQPRNSSASCFTSSISPHAFRWPLQNDI